MCSKTHMKKSALSELTIIYRAIDALIPYAQNARTHDDAQIAQIAKSIKAFGFTNPILIDERGEIIAGHGRVLAAQQLAIDRVPTIMLVGLSDAQKKAYRLADNKIALNSGWDLDLLKSELESLNADEFDLDLTGFGGAELLQLLADEIPAGLTDPDAVPDIEEDAVTQPGDVWILGNHRLMCSDSTVSTEIDKLVNSLSIDVIVFDPLYTKSIPVAEQGKKLLLFWDFKRFAIASHAAISAGWTPQYEFIWDCVQTWYTPNRPLARHKAVGVFSDDPFFNMDAAIIHDGKYRGPNRIVQNTRGHCHYMPLDGAKHLSTVESFPNTQQTDEHGHGKPIAWIEAIFRGIGGNLYLDLFGGSGTTLIACEKIGYQCLMMEIDSNYCDAIIKRWQNYTGKHATLESTGELFNDLWQRKSANGAAH